MKVATDGCLFGAWIANDLNKENFSGIILDIGTGTGLLSMMIVQKNPDIHVDAVEIEDLCAKQAEKNVSISGWQNKIQIIHADIEIFEPGKKYNVIISNPPFYSAELQSPDLNKNIAHHGTSLKIEEIGKIISRQLDNNGVFYLLMAYKRMDDLIDILTESKLYVHDLIMVKQRDDLGYSRIMVKGGFEEKKMSKKDLYVADVNGNYSIDFIDLLRDYYLEF